MVGINRRRSRVTAVSHKTRVRMHKSGKHWVRTVLSKIHIRTVSRVFESEKKTISSEAVRRIQSSSAVLKGAMLLGTLAGSYSVMDTVMADETSTLETEKERLVTADTVEMSTVLTDNKDSSIEEIQSFSVSESIAQSVSQSISESVIESQSELFSESLSESALLTPSFSESELQSHSTFILESESDSVRAIEPFAGLNRQLFDIALTSLNESRSLIVPESIETGTPKYQKYIVAKQAADQAWQMAESILAGKEMTQEELDIASKQIAQAANVLTGRITQLLGTAGSMDNGVSFRATATGTNQNILVFSESDSSAKYRDKQISLIEGRLDTTSNLINWRVVYNPVTNLSQAYMGLYIAVVSEMGAPQNLQVNGVSLRLDDSFSSRETLGTNLSTLDYTGRFYGHNYSLGSQKISLSGPVTYTFTTSSGSSLANIALYVQAALHPTSASVHATVKEDGGRTNLSGMMIGYKTSFISDGVDSFLQSTSESIQNSHSIRLSTSESLSSSIKHSLSESIRTSVSESLSESVSKSELLSNSESTSKSESLSNSESISQSESLSNLVSNSISESVRESVVESVSESVRESVVESLSESVRESVVESLSESVRESVVESLSESVSESISESTSESISESISESLSESVSGSVSESISESVSESISESVSESLSESVSESISESVSESISESVSESISESVSESISESTSESISESVSESLSESVSESISESVSES
ncbi:KxYKxGKxW signal peptide domain-containing protein, partial [Streptococcus suis]|uniref:KxYKxGKxW signal peptide domain-containing protein n=1 Tax=Streptococcus suis TaxID=1307 RepID=UPI0018745816